MNEIKVKLDKERTLRLTMKGMVEFKRLTGKDFLKGITLDPHNIDEVGALMYACLLHEDKDLTLDDVLVMIDIENIFEVADKLSECITNSLPQATERPLARKPRSG